jgi:hypothetical protein
VGRRGDRGPLLDVLLVGEDPGERRGEGGFIDRGRGTRGPCGEVVEDLLLEPVVAVEVDEAVGQPQPSL